MKGTMSRKEIRKTLQKREFNHVSNLLTATAYLDDHFFEDFWEFVENAFQENAIKRIFLHQDHFGNRTLFQNVIESSREGRFQTILNLYKNKLDDKEIRNFLTNQNNKNETYFLMQ
jgi:hypothetical protein